MSSDWDLVGGNPASGSPASIDGVIRGFGRVASQVDLVITDLRASGERLGGAQWNGEAADHFREVVATLPADLRLASQSHRQAADALRAYRIALDVEQQRARSVLASALQANHARDEQSQWVQRCRAAVDAETARCSRARDDLRAAERRLALAVDPASQTAARTSVAQARSRLTTAERDLQASRDDQARHERQRDAARAEVEHQQRLAEEIRRRVRTAADRAVTALGVAQAAGKLPNAIHRLATDTGEVITTYGPVLIQSLELAATLFQIAALVFPPGAAVFLPLGTILGGLGLGLRLMVLVADPDASPSDALDAVVKGLGVLGGGLALKGLTKAAALAPVAAGIIDIGGTTLLEGSGEGIERALSYGTGAALAWGGGALVKASLTQANKNPAIAAFITKESSVLSRTIDVVPREGVRLVRSTGAVAESANLQLREFRSLLSAGHLDTGRFLPGNIAAADYPHDTLGDHAVTAVGVDRVADGLFEGLVDGAGMLIAGNEDAIPDAVAGAGIEVSESMMNSTSGKDGL